MIKWSAEHALTVTIGDLIDADDYFLEDAHIYLIRDGKHFFYVGMSMRHAEDRVRQHLGIENLFPAWGSVHTLIMDNFPESRDWQVDLIRVTTEPVSMLKFIVRNIEAKLIHDLRPYLNVVHSRKNRKELPKEYVPESKRIANSGVKLPT